MDPGDLSDDDLDALLDRLSDRAAERDDLDLPGSGPSRRTVLATLLGAGGLGIGATQLGAAASWGSASGTVGTQSSPIDSANIRDLDAKLLEAEQMDITPYAEGTVTVSAGTREIVDNDTAYNSGSWIIAVSLGNTSNDNGRIETKWEGNATDGSVNAVVEEVKGNTTQVNWATIQLS